MGAKEKLLELKSAAEEIAEYAASGIGDEALKKMFKQCFISTAATTTRFLENGEAYVFTGDIEAMWLRDSSAQVVHYLPFLNEYPVIRELVKGLIKRQFFYIRIDPYANAFNEQPNGNCFTKDLTDSNPWEWERKYETDSLCYPVWLLYQYWSRTGDREIFDEDVKTALELILDTWVTEQQHEEQSPYRFQRTDCPETDTLPRGGKGSESACTGMTYSGFRPSDDACAYGYLVPANVFAASVTDYIAQFAAAVYGDRAMKEKAEKLGAEIRQGIAAYGIVHHEKFGDIYAYETDGLGHYSLMDDANVPSLLSLPWLAETGFDPDIYRNTRRFILSGENPYFFRGSAAQGIGSPHTPDRFIWHISLVMQGLTAEDQEEKLQILNILKSTDAGTGFMHEGFCADDPASFTRDWFAWANSLFALYILKLLEEGVSL